MLPPRAIPRRVMDVPKMLAPHLPTPPPALPSNLCFEDRGQGQIEIMPVMFNRARHWVETLYLGDDFKPVIIMKQRRAANVVSKEKTKHVLEYLQPTRKRKFKAKSREAEIQETFYWAPIAPENASTTAAFIDAMAVDSPNRSCEEERIVDSYWSAGMSLDPVLRTEKIYKTDNYLEIGQMGWRMKDHQDRGIEDGDLDGVDNGVDDGDQPLNSRPTKYQKITFAVKKAPSILILPSF